MLRSRTSACSRRPAVEALRRNFATVLRGLAASIAYACMEDDTSLAQSFRQRLAAERVPAMLVEACYDDDAADSIGGGGGGDGGGGDSSLPELTLGMRVRVSGRPRRISLATSQDAASFNQPGLRMC
jgi:hypothetical protein